jgi:putative DNA primase/helicase
MQEIEAALLVANTQRCKPPLSEHEVRGIAQSVSRYQPTITIEDVKSEVDKTPGSVLFEEFIMQEFPPREYLLDPVLPEQGLSMLYSYRGIGKSYLSMGIALATSSGGTFLRWKAPRPRKVLYLDGEMGKRLTQERFIFLASGMDQELPSNMLRIWSFDMHKPIPDLANPEGQEILEPDLEGVELLILDNLGTLCRIADENNAKEWLPVQDWVLRLRRRGISVLYNHHAGKSLAQRGTSKREDPLDIVMTLKHPIGYSAEEGLHCEVYFEKTRAMLAEKAKPFDVKLGRSEDGSALWTVCDLNEAKTDQIEEMISLSMSVKEIAEELGVSKSYVHRIRRQMGSSNGQ